MSSKTEFYIKMSRFTGVAMLGGIVAWIYITDETARRVVEFAISFVIATCPIALLGSLIGLLLFGIPKILRERKGE